MVSQGFVQELGCVFSESKPSLIGRFILVRLLQYPFLVQIVSARGTCADVTADPFGTFG